MTYPNPQASTRLLKEHYLCFLQTLLPPLLVLVLVLFHSQPALVLFHHAHASFPDRFNPARTGNNVSMRTCKHKKASN
jgi:hypothetical protein